MLRLDEGGERIPLTVADYDPEWGTVTIVIQALGKTTREMMRAYKEGDTFADFVGPLGLPQHIGQHGHVVLVGGGLGVAPVFPQLRAFKLAGKNVFGKVEKVLHRIDVNSLEHFDAEQLGLNEIGLCRIVVNAPAVFDTYRECRGSGSLIVIDRLSNATAGAGMIAAAAHSEQAAGSADELSRLRAFELELNALVRKHFPHWEAKDIGKLLQ